MLKIIGGVLIIFSSAFFGQFLTSKETFALEDLYGLKKGFMLLKSEINYLKTDLNEAFFKVSKSVNYGVKDFFYDFSTMVAEQEIMDIQLIWEKSFEKNKSKIHINNEMQKVIKEFGKVFDYQDINVLTNNIDFLIMQIESQIEIAFKRNLEMKKLYNRLSLLGGILVVVVLI